jgi:hypothetical protein
VANPFNLADESSFSFSDQRHRVATNTSTQLPWDVQVATIFFAGSKRPINTRTTLDPFGNGAGRWLDATGATTAGRLRLQGIVEAFNVLNTKNFTNYNGIVTASTYLQPASSTDVFYQPRQLQFAFRVTY